MSRRLRSILAGVGLLALAGCAGMRHPPQVPKPDAGKIAKAEGPLDAAQDAPVTQDAPLPDKWWHLYDDPRLDTLVEQALAANTDLRAADANVRRAEAVVKLTEEEKSIHTELVNAESGLPVPDGLVVTRPSGSNQDLPGSTAYNLGILATYPLDLTHRIKQAIAASNAQAEAAVAARDYVRVAVAAATTRAYAEVCSANEELTVNRQVVALQRQTLEATRKLAKYGRGTAFNVSRAETQVQTSEATISGFVAHRQAGLYMLAVLLGRAPADYPRDVADCNKPPELKQPLPAGDGATLIRRRPDIREAERMIAADAARLGMAHAELYPDITLAGSATLAGLLKGFGSPSSFGYVLGPLINWTFPNRSGARAKIEVADAQVQADFAHFDGKVLEALRQTETALDSYARDAERAHKLENARDSATLSASQAERLFRFGRGDFLSLLDAQRSLAATDAQASTARAQVLQDQIAVFLALGGGWQQGAQPAGKTAGIAVP